MARDHYIEIPWTLQVPLFCELGQIATLVDFDCTLSFHGAYLEGVHVAIETVNNKTFVHEIGCDEKDRNLRSIWLCAKHEYQTDSRLQHEVMQHHDVAVGEARQMAAEHAWEIATGR
jgi:hypothetical protein